MEQNPKYAPSAPFFLDEPAVVKFTGFVEENCGDVPAVADPVLLKIAAKALIWSFTWANSPQGPKFWMDVYHKLCDLAVETEEAQAALAALKAQAPDQHIFVTPEHPDD